MWYLVYFRQLIAALLSLSLFFAVTNRYKACNYVLVFAPVGITIVPKY